MELLQLPACAVPHSLAPSPWRVSPGKLPGGMEPQGLGQELPFQLESLEMPAGVCILMTRGFCSHCGPFVPHKSGPGRRARPGGSQHSTFDAFRTPNSADRGLSPALSPTKTASWALFPAVQQAALKINRRGHSGLSPWSSDPWRGHNEVPKLSVSFSLPGFLLPLPVLPAATCQECVGFLRLGCGG